MDFKKGFTLVELIIGFGLIGLVSVLVASLYFTNFRLFSNQSTSIDINSQNKIAVDEIVNEARQSQGVAESCCLPTETTTSTVLVLQLWPLDANGDPFDPSGNYDYIIYKADPDDSTRIQKKVVADASSTRPASTQILATALAPDGLQFTYDNGTPSLAAKVTVSVSTTGTAAGKTQTVTQTGSATLRNK
ncbi:hypothetical protein A2870_00235 [Candidatus Curtissbacteria bacterium RIFCSPHIGHO2_01_FULL_41_11]|uniref:Uncharacterized protein n=1 Tax=Candidatus Curtissbacteria bacterium RIFCSPHIGHO2_01_FULL_41_11 TaxID=1797711 RepID=A0A1F5G4A4_9BACT|nr:MAG: hypothetical protein A2870_00235 [Candidatus Curtissbacteria bacterium RIFCSPHIGHO2_01_FULL_41_11]